MTGPLNPSVREQERFFEPCFLMGNRRVEGDARQSGQAGEEVSFEGQGHQAGARFHHFQSELVGDPIGKTAGAHLRDRGAAGRDDERCRGVGIAIRGDGECVVFFFDPRHCRRRLDVDAACFRQQHVDNLLGGAVAEKLAVIAFLIGDTVALDQGDEVVLSIAGES